MVIGKAEELKAFCKDLSKARIIYVDTEFVGEGRYHTEVGAIQVATDGIAALVDPLAISDLSPLFEVLTTKRVEKVFHAGGQDLSIFYRMMEKPVAPMFDVQVAAAMLGYGEQISLAELVFRVTKERMRKSHTFTDWLKRPLSEKQVEYALEDVRCLVAVYEHLTKELEKRDRIDWAREEFIQMEKAEKYKPVEPGDIFRQIRGHDRLREKELSRLREIAAWREETARERNIPPMRICMDAVLVELARRPKDSIDGLLNIRGLRPDQVKRYGREMLEALNRGAGNEPPKLERRQVLPKELEPTVDFLVLSMRSLAEEREISPGLLANRNDLREVVRRGEKAKVPLMRGWRREAVGKALLATLEGQATAKIVPETKRVHLDWN